MSILRVDGTNVTDTGQRFKRESSGTMTMVPGMIESL
jgi:hypothetical protein